MTNGTMQGIPFRVCQGCGVFLEYRKRQRKCPVCGRTFGAEGGGGQ